MEQLKIREREKSVEQEENGRSKREGGKTDNFDKTNREKETRKKVSKTKYFWNVKFINKSDSKVQFVW